MVQTAGLGRRDKLQEPEHDCPIGDDHAWGKSVAGRCRTMLKRIDPPLERGEVGLGGQLDVGPVDGLDDGFCMLGLDADSLEIPDRGVRIDGDRRRRTSPVGEREWCRRVCSSPMTVTASS